MPPCAPAPVCRHVSAAGHPCGSPALRGKPVCYYHDAARQPLTVTRDLGRVLPNLPAPDDLDAIQIGYSQLLRLIAQDEIDPRTATLLLRTLAHASANLARIERRQRAHPAEPVTSLVLDPTFGPLAPEPVQMELNQYFTDLEQTDMPGAPSFSASSKSVGSPAPERTTVLVGPAHETEAPTPTLRPAPQLPEAPPTGPLTLAEQYILADREHTLSPAAHNQALAAITARLLHPTPEDRQRDKGILAAREGITNQYFAETEETITEQESLTLVHATAA